MPNKSPEVTRLVDSLHETFDNRKYFAIRRFNSAFVFASLDVVNFKLFVHNV